MRATVGLLLLVALTSGCRRTGTPQDRIVGHWEIRQTSTTCSDSLARSSPYLPTLTPAEPFCPRSDTYAPGKGQSVWITEAPEGAGVLRSGEREWPYSIHAVEGEAVMLVLGNGPGSWNYEFLPSADGDSLTMRRYINDGVGVEDLGLRPFQDPQSNRFTWEVIEMVYVDASPPLTVLDSSAQSSIR